MDRIGDIPAPPIGFVGRGAALSTLGGLFADGERLVTLVGPPGVGKTALALEFVERCAAGDRGIAPAGGVFGVDLSEAAVADDLLGGVARSLGVPVVGDGSPASRRLEDALEGRAATLLLLDGFEPLAASCARVVAGWLARAPELRVLVTSREALRLPRERVVELGPLDVPAPDVRDAAGVTRAEAVQLLCARAADFEVDGDDAADVAAIVRAVDGLPLALELLAPRLRRFGAARLRQTLDRPTALDPAGARDAPAHHRPLRVAIGGSWEVLGPDERAALAQCSVFRGGFDREAAEATVELGRPAPPVVAVLARLRDEGVVAASPGAGSTADRMRLHASVRAFAASQLADPALVERRHAEHYAALAQRSLPALDGPGRDAALARLTLERDNLARAYETLARGARGSPERAWALLGLHEVSSRTGPLDAHLDHLAATLEAGGAFDVALRAALHLARARAKRLIGEPIAAVEAAAAGLTLDAPPGARARLHVELGDARLASGDVDGARDALDVALALAAEAGDRGTEQRAWATRGLVAHAQGRLEEARADYARALELVRAREDRAAEADLLKDLGSLRLQQGAQEEARSCYERALGLARALDRRLTAVVQGNLAILDQEAGALGAARDRLEEALAAARHLGDRALSGHVQCYLGMLRLERGELSAAREALAQAAAVLAGVGDARMEGLALTMLGAAEAQRDRVEPARAAFEAAAARLACVDDPGLLAAHAILEAEIDLALARAERDPERAEALRTTALGRAEDGRPRAEASDDVRFALRVLGASLDGERLTFGPGATWFQLAGEPRVDLESRATLARVLDVLVRLRLDSPGGTIATDDILARAWPDERVMPEAGRNRVKVAVTTLRKLGLKGVLLHAGDGYLLDPAVPARRAAD